MKKLTYLFVLMFSLVLMSTSCCKEDDEIVPDVLTTQALVGNWDFVSLDYNGTVYDTDAELNQLNATLDLVALDFSFTTTSVTYTTTYVDAGDENPFSRTYSYTLSGTLINCDDQIKFEVVSFSNTQLKLKLKYCIQSGVPLDGVYTLTK
jgi:hypothetical protein